MTCPGARTLLLLCALAPAWLGFLQGSASVDAGARVRQARALFDARRFAEAAAEARRALDLDPANLDAWKLRALALQLAGRLPEAKEDLGRALERFSADADLWLYLARVLYLNHELSRGERAAREAIRLRAEHPDAHVQLGLIHEARLEYERALESYRTAARMFLAQRRSETLPLVASGELLLRLGRLAESLGSLDEAVRLDPRSARAHLARGRVLERLGRREEAESAYREAARLGAGTAARSHLARLESGASVARAGAPDAAPRVASIRFRNGARKAGVEFVLQNSPTPHKYQIETMPGGVAALDYDGDGWLDLYFCNGAEVPSLRKTGPSHWNRLYRNNRDGTFTDDTASAGVAGEGYAMGAAAADYDNDGRVDLFVAGVHRNLLYRNRGGGRFEDVTARARLSSVDPKHGKLWSVAAAWLDYDIDGDLDLFVVNYCKWSPELDPYCGGAAPGYRTYCYPDRYEGLPNQLFRNDGGGAFTDVSESSGIGRHVGKGMGVAVADYDLDGRPDILVANDTLPTFLFHNLGGGRFEEVALRAGVAVPEAGAPVSGMGVDFRDYDGDGLADAVISALEGETFPLFRNLGKGFFADETFPSGLGAATARRSGWGVGFVDLDNDGWKDLFTANAHVNDNIELFNEQTYRQACSVFAGIGAGRFRDASVEAGRDFQARAAHRGCAFGDFDNDGRIDAVTTALGEPAEIFFNESPEPNHWLRIELRGSRSNRDGLGAAVALTAPDGRRQYNHATTAVGYASSSDRRVHFGLGGARTVSLEVRWPGGAVQILRDVVADQVLRVTEPTASR